MNPRPYSSDWPTLSESELLASYRNSAPVAAEERTRVPAEEESDRAYAARLFEQVAREIADEDFALAILREWGIASDTEHAADAPDEETGPPRRGAGPGVGGGLSRAEAQSA